jgi:hypothetical protein
LKPRRTAASYPIGGENAASYPIGGEKAASYPIGGEKTLTDFSDSAVSVDIGFLSNFPRKKFSSSRRRDNLSKKPMGEEEKS